MPKEKAPPVKDRIAKRLLDQQVRNQEIDEKEELLALVGDQVQPVYTDTETINDQVLAIEQFFWDGPGKKMLEENNIIYKKPTNNPKGAKPIIDKSNVTKLMKYLSLGFDIREACQQSGFSYRSYYRFLDMNPQFSHVFEQIKDSYLAYLAKRNLAMLLIEGDKDATFEWLRSNDPRYRKTPEVSVNTQNNLILNVPPERAKVIIDSIAKKAKILEEGRYGTITRSQ